MCIITHTPSLCVMEVMWNYLTFKLYSLAEVHSMFLEACVHVTCWWLEIEEKEVLKAFHCFWSRQLKASQRMSELSSKEKKSDPRNMQRIVFMSMWCEGRTHLSENAAYCWNFQKPFAFHELLFLQSSYELFIWRSLLFHSYHMWVLSAILIINTIYVHKMLVQLLQEANLALLTVTKG